MWTHGSEHLDPAVRASEKAPLPRDPMVRCIEERARALQGWPPDTLVEQLWAQRYTGPAGHYAHHYDWGRAAVPVPAAARPAAAAAAAAAAPPRWAGRVSSVMVYLRADCAGGGTNFPRLRRPPAGAWCRFIECDAEDNAAATLPGITFHPIQGNAVFWQNLRFDGSGYRESWHAGLPVRSGVKVGLNIWSWYQDGLFAAAEAAAAKESEAAKQSAATSEHRDVALG